MSASFARLARPLVRGGFAIAGLLLCALAAKATEDRSAGALVPASMRVGFTPTAFLQTNRNDVEAAIKVLGEAMGRTRGYRVAVTTHLFPDASALPRAVDAGEINFAVIDSLGFLAERSRLHLTPIFIPSTHGKVGRRYLLLVRRDSGLHTLDDLRDKRIVELQAPDLSVGRTWLQSLVLGQGARSQEEYFRSIEYVGKPSAAVLPVFFGRQDACLADDFAFRLMTELNPQVGAQLESLAISAPLLNGVICLSDSDWSPPEFRPALIKGLSELQSDPAGRQVLDLFKIDQLVPFTEGQLDTARDLLATFIKLHPEAAP